MHCKFFKGTGKALCFQWSFIIFFMLLSSHQLEAQDEKAQKVGPGIVKEHSRGLHGYISYNADKPADQSSYSYGMGFYSAVWPLITRAGLRLQNARNRLAVHARNWYVRSQPIQNQKTNGQQNPIA